MNYYTDVLKKYAVFNGRARRKEYWMFFLYNAVISIVLTIVGALIHFGFLNMLYFLIILLPSLGLGIRRLHDTGRSGWWIFISLIPIVGIIILLVFMVIDSQPGENQYGPNPKNMAVAG